MFARINKLASFPVIKNMSSSSYSNVLIEKFGQVMTIGINRPHKRNCVDLETAVLLKNSIEEFEQDNSSLAAVLYGTGGNFCSGFDLNELTSMNDSKEIETLFEKGLMDLSQPVKKPIVAAISGYAVAGGLELALMCDLRVIEETAIIGLYGRRFGIPLTKNTTVRLQSMLGLSRALDMIITGRSLSAREAFEWGVANRIVACGSALGQAINLASSLVKFPQECLNTDRDSIYNAAFSKAYNDLTKGEHKREKKLLIKEAIEGAKKFIMSGIGRHGKSYNLTERDTCEWEKDFIESPKEPDPKSKL